MKWSLRCWIGRVERRNVNKHETESRGPIGRTPCTHTHTRKRGGKKEKERPKYSREVTLPSPWRLKKLSSNKVLGTVDFTFMEPRLVTVSPRHQVQHQNLQHPFVTPSAIIVRIIVVYLLDVIFFYRNCEISPCFCRFQQLLLEPAKNTVFRQ